MTRARALARRLRTAATPPAGGVVLCGGDVAGAVARRAPVLRSCTRMMAVLALAGCAAPAPDPGSGPGLTPIAAVQGAGATSPLLGQAVTVQGVVTAPLRGLGGFMLQDPRGDGDPATAEALFVAWTDPAAIPVPGTWLRASGTVAEPDAPHGITTLDQAQFTAQGRVDLPAPVVLDAAPASWEALEGMRVRIRAPLTVTGNHGLWRFGELLTAFDGRLWQPTELHPPGTAADALAAANAARQLVLDDARARQYPPRLWQLPQPLSAAAPLRAGSRIDGVEGVVDQRFGRHRLQPTAPFGGIDQAPRPPRPEVPGTLHLATFNVLNFFNGDGGDGGFPTARGADTPAEFARQRDKLVAALAALDADILALLEIENDGSGPGSALATLAAALDAAMPGARWQAVAPPAPGGDAIQVALLYRADRVAVAGRPAQLATGPFAYGSRPPLAQAFVVGDGAPLVVAVNHFKSKGGCGEARGADVDQGDGQACFNASRVAAAEALARWLASDPTGTGTERTLIVGDLNAYAQEDPLRALRRHGYTDLLAGRGAHSYTYDGQAGRLDHALASPAALPLVTGAAPWNANADESDAFDYNLEHRAQHDLWAPTPWRASDHDPLLIGLSAPGR